MRKFIRRLHRNERGSVTAEYAMVLVAAVSFAVLLVLVFKLPAVKTELTNTVLSALRG